MRIITWNINSVRLRIKLLANLVAKAQPDIICLQETKVADQQFPLSQAQQIMPYAYYLGNPLQSGYNGVAILSKMPLDLIPPVYWYGKNDARFIGARLPNGTEIHNFYVPAGGDEPDPKINAKYAHKLQFAEEMTNWYQQNYQPDHKIIMLGDLNIAPQEHDVWSHKQLLKVVSHTEPEVSRMKQLQQTLNWCDVGRHFTPAEQKLYSWWSYRNRDWQKSNRGRRLDHIWVTPPLVASLNKYYTFTECRNWLKPSDHVPIAVDLNIE